MAANLPEHQFIPQTVFFFFFNHLSRLLVLSLLMCAGVHPNPGPSHTHVHPKTLVQFNCNGIHSSKTEIQDFIDKYQVKIVALQETKLNAKSKQPSFLNYNLVKRDRPAGGRGGGIAFLIHHSVRFVNLDTSELVLNNDLTIELQGISANIDNQDLKIFNVYIPPVSANTQYQPDISRILDVDDDAIILGDFNAHNEAWQSGLSDDRGDFLAQQVENSNFFILNSNSQTRLPSNGSPSSPDISMISAHLALSVTWETSTSLNSDHLPICITFIDDQPPPRTAKSYVNYKRAKWGLLSSELELLLANEPRPTKCSSGVGRFNKLLTTASKHHIPAGFRQDFRPGLSREAVNLTNERDRLREQDPQDPEVTRLNQVISETVINDSRKRWKELVQDSRPNANPDKHWRLMRILSGKRPQQPPNQPIFFGDKCFSKPKVIASKFCRQFTSTSAHKTSRHSRRVKKNLKRTHRLDFSFKPFTDELTKKAIEMSSNSSAAGPDGLTMLHLKHLGPLGISYLTELFNLSVACADIPAVWKKANIIPIPKPGKAAGVSTSYRPISLLSPCVKVLERLLLPYLTVSLPSSSTQHGYKAFHSTVTALLPIVTNIAIGLNKDKPASRTAMVALDISKAFDAVDHDLLLEKITGSTLNSNIVRWLCAYLHGRTAVCLFQGAESAALRCHSGVPQGSVLSPHLFNFFVSDFPSPAEVNENYADDFYLTESASDVNTLGPILTAHLELISQWAVKNKLSIAPSKSSVTIFTPWNREVNFDPRTEIDGDILPVEKNIKALGVMLNNMFKFSTHSRYIEGKLNSRLQLLKATSGQDWGDKGTLRMTYSVFMKPIPSYAAPIWYPSMKPDSVAIQRLQRIQNSAMRVITGAHKMSSRDHLLAETQLLPVSAHLDLTCTQFLACAMVADHPSHATVNLPSGNRCGRKDIVHTLQSRFGGAVQPFLKDGVLPPANLKKALNTIHTAAVDASKRSLSSKLLGRPPPDIDPSEGTLPRRSRVTLGRLRSTYCKDLKSFQKTINSSPDDICPACRGAPHTTEHVFDCSALPTDLSVIDLWKRPREAASFLRSTPSFDYLPPNPRPPPEPWLVALAPVVLGIH